DARDELLAAVYAAPFDDGPRAVLADYLLERNDPRGEFIALQLKRGDKAPSQRERELLRTAGRTWFDGLDDDGARDIELARGFPIGARPGGECRAPGGATIETLRLRRGDDAFRGSPLLTALRRLHAVQPAWLPAIELPRDPEVIWLSPISAEPLATQLA